MGAPQDPDSEELIRRAGQGDQVALGKLLDRHRDRLRRMVALRMDPRLAARIDPSDVVQEALMDVARKLPDYLHTRPLPFYPWLRRITWERLVHVHARHLDVQKRSVTREAPQGMTLSDESVMQLAERFVTNGTSPSRNLLRKELRRRVQDALQRIQPHDREVLLLRYLEQLSIEEIAHVLQISEGAVSMRHLRALERLRGLLDDTLGDQRP